METSLLGTTRLAVNKHKAQQFSTSCIEAVDFGGVASVQGTDEYIEVIWFEFMFPCRCSDVSEELLIETVFNTSA